MRGLVLFLAQGCGVGRVPVAPGTFGSILGLLWTAALLWTGSFWLWTVGTLLGIFGAVWICGRAEDLLGQPDPSTVVLDEIVAVPICFAGWIILLAAQLGELPAPKFFFQSQNWLLAAGIFAAFRFFDVLKPWPVRQSQRWPGGWGVVMDDLLAAGYVNIVAVAVWLFGSWESEGALVEALQTFFS
jgi:phosphatidylglycerophosphatase A